MMQVLIFDTLKYFKLCTPRRMEGVLKIFFSKFCCVKFSLTFAIPKKGVVLYCCFGKDSDSN
jgi:hypothetical protein